MLVLSQGLLWIVHISVHLTRRGWEQDVSKWQKIIVPYIQYEDIRGHCCAMFIGDIQPVLSRSIFLALFTQSV